MRVKKFNNHSSPKSKMSVTKKEKPIKKMPEPSEKSFELPEIALAAIASYRRQKEVADFINFLLSALEKNAAWLNGIVGNQKDFRCALLVGAGPNRFQFHEMLYPSTSDVKLEVELKDSEDHDKIAIAALVRLNNFDLEYLLKYMKTRLGDNNMLREDLLKGKALGVTFAVLRPFSEKQYRVVDRIVIGSSLRSIDSIKKRRKEEKFFTGPPIKKTKKVTP